MHIVSNRNVTHEIHPFLTPSALLRSKSGAIHIYRALRFRNLLEAHFVTLREKKEKKGKRGYSTSGAGK